MTGNGGSDMILRSLALMGLLLVSGATALAQERPAVQVAPPDGDGAKYWPRWRGPSGQGLVADANYPDKWSPTENVL